MYIKDEVDTRIDKTFMWTDITTVLQLIKNSPQKQKIFVANRLNIIIDSTDWRYIPSSDDPANDRRRRYTVSQRNVNSRWIQRPPFLSHSERFWPAQPTSPQQVAVSLTHQPTDHHKNHSLKLLASIIGKTQLGLLPSVSSLPIKPETIIPKLSNFSSSLLGNTFSVHKWKS